MKPLQFSVAFFSVVIVSAYHTEHIIYHHLYVALLVFGLLNHGLSYEQKVLSNHVHFIDVTLAHVTFCYTLYEGYNSILIVVSVIDVAILYLLEHVFTKYTEFIHMSIHLHIVITMVVYLNK